MSGLPAGWKEISLDLIGQLHCGQSPASATVNLTGQGTLYVTGPEQWDGTRLHQGKWTTSPQKVVPDGCIFITVKGAGVGKLFPGIACAIGRDVYAFESAKGVDRDFVRLALKHNIQEIVRSARGDIPGLSRNDILGHEVRLPPLAEQRRIVAKLDALDARAKRARADLDRIPALVARAKQAILEKAFDGELLLSTIELRRPLELIEVSQIADVVTGTTPPTAERELFFGGNIPFFKPTDLDVGYQVRECRETLTDEGARRGRCVPAGSTLLTCIGATIGKAGLARVACCTNQQINALVPSEAVIAEWLFWIVNAPQFKSQVLTNASATTLPILNKGRLLRLQVPVVDKGEQAEIVRRIESAFQKIDRIAADAASASRLLTRLDQAILTKAFRGELVPQNREDEPAEKLLARIKTASAAHGNARGRKRKPKTGMTA
ncbi:hypothetical protein CCR94_10785 [Rhodoblastus sphagnicola]|uniref:Type I restriction modification DNA specificity domain-containing protein n=1 Tax=Rhodoblastus sphagnicola TaxID=333368 RepID=A0A2S6N8M4_9HYPH|nr:restriction endonuclease subunit S [Rhodoblastus sphagnicola]MBB4199936.1 type I restriction enzyme S subunit [Rhodoblastus sphagnicola]PPQ30958.1 hypothetical protein CCR94_10785 [Rhodoblastus sphagnicola]